jgi:hypothetical protein
VAKVRRRTPARLHVVAVSSFLALVAVSARAGGQARAETLRLPDGHRLQGRLAGDAKSGFGFTPAQSTMPQALEAGSIIEFDTPGPNALESPPAFRVLIGGSLRLSGSLRSIDRDRVRLGLRWQNGDVTLTRPGVQAVVQRPGEARVLVDGFEAIDTARWSITGKPELADQPRQSEKHSLRLPTGGTALVHALAEPIPTGRFDVAFFDDGAVVAGQQWSIELTFQGASGAAPVRVALGWSEESLAVESLTGPTLTVQRLARTPGWHRLSLRFAPDQTEVSVDGKELAHGKGPEGPLIAIRLASTSSTQTAPPKGLAGHLDDLQLIRFAEPPASLEIDIAQDEARLVVGDQFYGTINQSDEERLAMTVDGEPIVLAWADVSGLYFRRLPAASARVAGLLARVEWRSAAGDDPDNIDFAEGAITSASDRGVNLVTPYAGTLSIPRELLRKVVVQGLGSRIVIDPCAHHLGDEYSATAPVLEPPQPEGALLERTVDLTEIPSDPCFLVLDVVEVVGMDNDSRWSQLVRDGELRTYIVVNGKRVDFLNRFIRRNDGPERVAIPVPTERLRTGKNSIRLELTGMTTKENELDDFGVLQMALEFRPPPGRAPEPPHAPNPP